MRERYELGLKIACAVLAGWLLFQAARAMIRPNPLTNLKIPDLPTLATASESATNSTTGKQAGAAGVSAKGKTNSAELSAIKSGSNSVVAAAVAKEGSNSNAAPQSSADSKSNKTVSKIAEASTGTNGGPLVKGGSNLLVSAGGTNKTTSTNSSTKGKRPGSPPDMAMMMGGPGRAGRPKAPDLSPAVQARVDKVVESELLGPVIRPMPMGLLGIAGSVAIIRSPSGQTGLVKEGDEMGGIKLLRIGTNRVLVEQSGEKKELMIFSGYGGETLMPKENEKTNEPTSKKP
jgi:hypothetical protein